jgi:hypothetical protein
MRALLTISDRRVINPKWDWPFLVSDSVFPPLDYPTRFPDRNRANSKPETTVLKTVGKTVVFHTASAAVFSADYHPQLSQGAVSASSTARANKGGFWSIAKWDTPGRITKRASGMVLAM